MSKENQKEKKNLWQRIKIYQTICFSLGYEGLMVAKIPFFQQETDLDKQKQTSEVSERWDQAPLLPPCCPESKHIRLASVFYPSPQL